MFYSVQYEEYIPLPPPIPPLPPEDPPLPEDDDSQDSNKDESEYESADEEEKERLIRLQQSTIFWVQVLVSFSLQIVKFGVTLFY